MLRTIDYSPPGILFINGMSGAGKTSVARIIAQNCPRSAHIEELSSIGLWLDTSNMTPEHTAEMVIQRAFSEGLIYS